MREFWKIVTRRAIVYLALIILMSAAHITGAQAGQKWTQAQAAALANLTQYLQNLKALEGRFIQIDAQGGSLGGKFLYAEGGRLKFIYDAPATMIVMVKKNGLYIQEEAGKAPDIYPLAATPLPLFLNSGFDFANQASTRDVIVSGTLAEALLEDPSGDAAGRLYLTFDTNPTQLRGWRVVDAQGQNITLVLRDLVERESLADEIFELEYRRKRGPRR
ncbi:MAG: LolA family protein [Parvibaculales bacterium]